MTNAVITAQIGSSQTDYGFKNRVINGDFRINQRNGTSLVTGVTAGASYWLADRFRIGGSALATGRYSFQTVADAPPGFVNSGKVTVTTAQTPAASDIQVLTQIIEGVNVSDFAWGTSSAVAVSLSFWVKANLSGQYVVAVRADNNSATYLGAYTITTANAWQYVTISIPGTTFGNWGGLTLSTTTGIRLDFNLGTGTTTSNASTNTWLAGDFFRTTSDVQLIQTLGATWQITGIQLEVGSTASGFDYRNYGTELTMCQRYYCEIPFNGTHFSGQARAMGMSNGSATNIMGNLNYPTTMRAAPSHTYYAGGATTGNINIYSSGSGAQTTYSPAIANVNFAFQSSTMFGMNIGSVTGLNANYTSWCDMGWGSGQLGITANAEL